MNLYGDLKIQRSPPLFWCLNYQEYTMSITSLTTLKVKPRRATKLILDHMEAGNVPYLSGSPGVGKSSIIKKIADMLDLFVVDHRLSTSEPTDMNGLPNFDDEGYAYFAPFKGIFPTTDTPLPKNRSKPIKNGDGKVVDYEPYRGWLLFLDELPAAPREVQAAAFKLILDRMVGQHYLHPRVYIVAAGNLTTDRSVVNPLVTAMQSRLIHFELEVCHIEWLQDVAFPNEYDPRIIGFIGQYGESKLLDFRPDHHDKTFACPRTWEFLNNLLRIYTKRKEEMSEDHLAAITGTISMGMGTEFWAYCKSWKQLVTPREILADPQNCRIPTGAPIRWTTISSIVQAADDQNFKKLSTYVDRFDMGFRLLFYRLLKMRKPEMRYNPEFIDAMALIDQYTNPPNSYVDP